MRNYFSILKKTVLFEKIAEENFERVLGCLDAHIKNYKKNETIRHPETRVSEIGIIVKGLIYISKQNIDGKRIILAESGVGKTFGESLAFTEAENSPISITAARDSSVVFISVKRIFGTCRFEAETHKIIMENTVRLLAEKNALLQIKNDILSQKNTREKLLLYFEYESKTAKSKTFKIHFSREELADFLALNASALSRELGKMRDEGILAFQKNRFVLKLNREQ